ncbi:MAG: hypothetical protein IVW55_07630 [Chloroflexi bacterium]|nr:hypothetical protein [Chloroflexota bacterium]
MEAAPQRATSPARLLRYLSLALLVYGAVGVAVQLRLLPFIAQGISGWNGLPDPSTPPIRPGWLDLLQAHYDALPWLPTAAWLVGLGLPVGLRRKSQPRATAENDQSAGEPQARWLIVALLILLLLLAGYVRMVQLWPQSNGLSQQVYDDEGVYAGASQLFLQGILPYRDYFFAHPPMAAISYAPALAYHFTEWGSPTSFMMARYLSVAYSLLTLVFLFFIGLRLVGLWGGTLAGVLWALDGRVVEINRKVMLDGPMVLLSCGALLLYLWVRPALEGGGSARARRRPFLWLGLAGAFAALSALTKIAGVACLVAILADILWLGLEKRGAAGSVPRIPLARQLASTILGALVAGIIVVGPFLLAAPSQFVRMVFFFQLLRPSDGVTAASERLANVSLKLNDSLTLVFAALGFIVLSIWVWRRTLLGPWRAIVLWTFFSLLLFTYSRSFYQHYYIQLAAPLCLLGAGFSIIPRLLNDFWSFGRTRLLTRATARLLPYALAAILTLPLAGVEWLDVTGSKPDRLFEIVSRYINDAVPPGTPVLTTDEQFNFRAARPPSRNSTGYLVDSYGHMIYLALGLNNRSWGDLTNAVLQGQHSADVYAVLYLPAAQADILDRASRVPLIAIHDGGRARLTPETLSQIASETTTVEKQARYTVYRVNR